MDSYKLRHRNKVIDWLYADVSEQLYDSDVDPTALNDRLAHDVQVANTWNNGMIVNDTKHQAMVLGVTCDNFSFPLKNAIEIFGLIIDDKLNFNDHISTMCKKIKCSDKIS